MTEINNLWQLAQQHLQQGRLQQAYQCLLQVHQSRPQLPVCAQKLGEVALMAGQLPLAMQWYDKAQSLSPNLIEAWLGKGDVWRAQRAWQKALFCYEQAVQLQPRNALAQFQLGYVHDELGEFDKALEHYSQVLEIEPDDVETLDNRSTVWLQLGQYQQALDDADHALRLANSNPQAHVNRGNALVALLQFEKALGAYDEALHLNPQEAQAWSNRGNVLDLMGRLPEAISSLEKAVTLDPNFADAQFNLSTSLIKSGQLEKGWSAYEWRWKLPGRQPLQTPHPRWDTTRQEGQRVLVWSEQGLGDQILWSGLIQDFAAQCKGEILIQVDSRLLPLMQRSSPQFQWLGSDAAVSPTRFDAHIPMASLGGVVRPNLAALAERSRPYLRVDAMRVQAIRQKLSPDGRSLCGVSWRSSNSQYGRDKSMALADMWPCLEVPGWRFVNLQYGDVVQDLQTVRTPEGPGVQILDGLDLFNDIDGLAHLIAACDMVVSASNSTVHLAGALGKPVHLLLSSGKGLLWYWHHQQSGFSLWYPSVRLHVKQYPNEPWTELACRVARIISS